MAMPRKQIDIAVHEAFLTSPQAVARETATGREVARATGKDRQDAIARVIDRVRQIYPDAEIIVPR
jgi:hypothetical protein